MWTVSALWVTDWAVPVPVPVPVPDWAGFRVFWRESSVCKGWNPVRVPPRAKCFRRSGALIVFLRVHFVHTLVSDPMFRVCGLPDRAIRGCGGGALYGGPGTARWSLVFEYILFRPFRWVRVHNFMVARAAYNVTC